MYSPWLRKAFTRTAQGHHNESSNWNLKQPHYDRRTGRIQLYLGTTAWCLWPTRSKRCGGTDRSRKKYTNNPKPVGKRAKLYSIIVLMGRWRGRRMKLCEKKWHLRKQQSVAARAATATNVSSNCDRDGATDTDYYDMTSKWRTEQEQKPVACFARRSRTWKKVKVTN